MKRLWIASLAIFGCGSLGLWFVHSLVTSVSGSSEATSKSPAVFATSSPAVAQDLPTYQRYALPNSDIHTITLAPRSRLKVSIALSPGLRSIEQLAKSEKAIAAINGGFFDPTNQKTTSYGTKQRQLVLDPNQNERLIENPQLQPYLPQILDRSEFRQYDCGTTTQYAIARRSEQVPAGCTLAEAMGGGPQLLPKFTAQEEGFIDQQTGRDAIGVAQRNARSAIGLKPDGSVVLVMAAQKPDAPEDSGMSMQALTGFMQRLGIDRALNLDGGSSAALIYQDQMFYGKVEKNGQPVLRAIKSAIVIHE